MHATGKEIDSNNRKNVSKISIIEVHRRNPWVFYPQNLTNVITYSMSVLRLKVGQMEIDDKILA